METDAVSPCASSLRRLRTFNGFKVDFIFKGLLCRRARALHSSRLKTNKKKRNVRIKEDRQQQHLQTGQTARSGGGGGGQAVSAGNPALSLSPSICLSLCVSLSLPPLFLPSFHSFLGLFTPQCTHELLFVTNNLSIDELISCAMIGQDYSSSYLPGSVR